MISPFYLVPFKYFTWFTLCKVVEIFSKALQETNVRPPESLAKKKNLSTVCDVAEISFKAPMETIVRVLEFLTQETSLRSRRLKLKFPFNLKVTSFLSRINIWDVKEISLLIFLSYGNMREKKKKYWRQCIPSKVLQSTTLSHLVTLIYIKKGKIIKN